MLIPNNVTILFGDDDRADVNEHITDVAKIFLARGHEDMLYKAVKNLYINAGTWDTMNILKEAVPCVKEVFDHYTVAMKELKEIADSYDYESVLHLDAVRRMKNLEEQATAYIEQLINYIQFAQEYVKDFRITKEDVERSYKLRSLETGHGKMTPSEIFMDDFNNVYMIEKKDLIEILVQNMDMEKLANVVNYISNIY